MDSITVLNKDKTKLLKLKKQIIEAWQIWQSLPEDVQEKIYEACDGDSIGSCLDRGSELIVEVCDNLLMK